MPDCSACDEDASMPFRCKFCDETFCSEHRLPENHDCEGLREYTDKSRQEGTIGYDVMNEDDEAAGTTTSVVDARTGFDWERYLPERVTVAVLGVMLLGFVLRFTVPGVTQAFAIYPDVTAFTQPWRLVTALFLHGGLAHLLVNGIVLWSFGRHLERILGQKRFLQVLLSAGIVSSAAIAVSGIAFGMQLPAMGLSGGLLGLVTLLAVIRPEVRVLAFFIIPLRIRHAVAFFGLIDAWNLAAQALGVAGPYQLVFGPGLQIASAGHLAGLLTGAVYGYLWQDRYRRHRSLSVWDMVQ